MASGRVPKIVNTFTMNLFHQVRGSPFELCVQLTYTRHTSSCMCVDCSRSPESLT